VADIVDRATRSRMMSGIKGRNTRPELIVRSHLHRAGLRYSLHRRDLPGKPDIVLSSRRVAIFVHGCFWHQHKGCRFAYMPKSNARFWKTKLNGNSDRDQRRVARLRRAGWAVFVVWECQTGNAQNLSRLVARVRRRTKGDG
jgi:DNA mismatch endonuclease, patch repair protein